MDWNIFRDYLLNNMPGAKVCSGGKEIVLRCPECGDSTKNSKSAHLYIGIPYDNNKPALYNCFHCGTSGILTHNTLIKWGIYRTDIALGLTEYNNTLKLSGKANRYFHPSAYQITHSYVTINSKTEEKRQYVCNRIGRDLSVPEMCDLKICLNLIDLLEENNVKRLTRDKRIVQELDREFVGFISIDNAFLNMRRTCPEGIVSNGIDKRYINYKIFDKDETSQRFYTVPTVIDLNSKERIKLHIAEGPFDILSVYLNLRNKEPGIYTSVSGNNYINVIFHFLIEKQIPYIELHFYGDNDQYGSINRIEKIMKIIPDKTIPVYVHKNTYPGEKDFGVPIDRIQESIIKIR